MNADATRPLRQSATEESLALLAGGAFTLVLFLGMAHFENAGATPAAAEIEEVRMAALPFEPPPPTPHPEETEPPEIRPLSGIEISAADSPVSIATVPPDLEALIPATTMPPQSPLQFGVPHPELKPRTDWQTDTSHVYQEAEVDQPPRPLVRVAPDLPQEVRSAAPSLHVTMLLLIDQNGRAENARVLVTSGNPVFDAMVCEVVLQKWLFTPAIRHGKKVRVLAHQNLRIVFSGRSTPFEVK
jgi:TonB family protein